MWVVSGFGMLCVGVGVAGAVGLAILPLYRAHAARAWRETRCHIERSEIESHEDSSRAAVAYSYEVGGNAFHSDRIDFAVRIWSSDDLSAQADVAHYRAGGDVACWYEPDQPSLAVLSRTAPVSWFAMVPALFGIFGFVFVRRSARHARDGVPGAPRGDGRHSHVRRCSGLLAVFAIATLWLMASGAAMLAVGAMRAVDAMTLLDGGALLACAALATLALLHELRCLLSVVTVIAPVRLAAGETGRAAWSVRSPTGSPRATASVVAVATTSESTERTSALSYEMSSGTTVETVLTIPVQEDALQPGTGTLSVPDDARARVRLCPGQIDWFLAVRVHVPLGPDATVRVPIDVSLHG